jgi:hypothetical protein
MMPAGRRLLRLNLATFWFRAENDDRIALEEQGIPWGFRPPQE